MVEILLHVLYGMVGGTCHKVPGEGVSITCMCIQAGI